MIECAATDKELVLNVAWFPLKVPVPMLVAPSLKVTVPVGAPTAGETTLMVAVKVTVWPKTEGLLELATVVVVLPLLTVWLALGEVLPLKLLSPP